MREPSAARHLALLLLTFALAGSLQAQAAPEAISPEMLAETYFQKLQAQDWPGVAALFSPAAKSGFRGMMDPVIQSAPPEMRGQMLQAFFGPGSSAEQIAAMSNDVYFASLLGGILQQSMSAAGLEFGDMEILGGVDEGADLRHMVSRFSIAMAGGAEVTKMEVVTVERVGEGWGIALGGELEGMAALLQMQMEQAAAAALGPAVE